MFILSGMALSDFQNEAVRVLALAKRIDLNSCDEFRRSFIKIRKKVVREWNLDGRHD